jgi:NADPH2:quinone reductase
MTRSIEIRETGGPEVMQLVDRDLPPPGPGMARVRNQAIGLNYIDTYHRSGLYPLPLPTGLGLEGAGIIEEIGSDAELSTGLKVGDRVAYCSAGFGAYAEAINLPAERLVEIPDAIDFDQAAAALLKGQTAEYLIQRTYPLKPGETCLFHAAAGGVGLIFGQWARSIGAIAIGTVSSAQKADLALDNGFTHVINYSTEDVTERVMEITDGARLPVVYDGVGADTFDTSLDCLRPRGLMVSFGNASGAPPPLDLQTLSTKGSLYITRPTMLSYTASRQELQKSSADLFERVADGRIKIHVNQHYALEDVQQAHRDLETRKTTGSTILQP